MEIESNNNDAVEGNATKSVSESEEKNKKMVGDKKRKKLMR